MLSVDQILAMSEAELRQYGSNYLLESIESATVRLFNAGEDLELAIEEIERPDELSEQDKLDFAYYDACVEHGFVPDDTDRLWFTTEWDDGQVRPLAERIKDLRDSKRAQAKRNREDFETFCWAWQNDCLAGIHGGILPRPPVNPWPYK